MVSFRLSRAEYVAAEDACNKLAVRSVSSLARDAVLGVIGTSDSSPVAASSGMLASLQSQVQLLRVELEKLAAAVGGSGSGDSGASQGLLRKQQSVGGD